MAKIIIALAIFVFSFPAFAHKDRVLPIQADGTLGVLPRQYGPVKVLIDRSKQDPSSITNVELLSPRFHVRLNSCVVDKLSGITRIEASGSWYDLNGLPPYVSLDFYSGVYDPRSSFNEWYSITFSLVDGHIIGGVRYWDPWWGEWRGKEVRAPEKCSGWDSVGLWPNKSFKPTPLRGSA